MSIMLVLLFCPLSCLNLISMSVYLPIYKLTSGLIPILIFVPLFSNLKIRVLSLALKFRL